MANISNSSLAAGSSLLAALHSSLEHIKTIRRVCRALSKKPQSRTSIEVGYIMAETERLALMTREGPGVHRDLCHVARVVSLKEMDSLKLPPWGPSWTAGSEGSGAAGGAGAGGGGAGAAASRGLVYIYVLQGKVQLRTRRREPFAPRLAPVRAAPAGGGDASGGGDGGGVAPGTPRGSTTSRGGGGGGGGQGGLENVTEDEMRALFKSIDVDGSGAIDVSELQTALQKLGMHVSSEEVSEMLDGVDEDGSGELEFDEFKAVLRKAVLGARGGAAALSEWREQGGFWHRDLSAGAAVGEAALLDPAPGVQDGNLLALDRTDLLLLERTDYERILENGFDGELKAKVSLLRSAPVLGEVLRRTDFRMLAYAMVRRTAPMNAALYEQGQPPTSLDLILEGHCKLVVKVPYEPASNASSRRNTEFGIAAPGQSAAPIGGGGGAASQAAASLHSLGEDDWSALVLGAGGSSSTRALLRRPMPSRAGRTKRLELAVLGPGDMCSEASVLGEERHPHSCVVTTSSGVVTLSLSVRDLRKLVHPTDLAALRAHFAARLEQRSARLAVATNVASVAAGELSRLSVWGSAGNGGGGMGAEAGAGAGAGMGGRRGPAETSPGREGGGGEGQREAGDGGELAGEASGAGAGFWPSLARRRTTVQGLTGAGGGGGGGEVEEVPPGAAEVALGKLAALLRGKSRKSLTQLTSESSTGAVGTPVRTTSSFAVRQSCSASGTPAAWAAVVAAATAAATAGSAAPPVVVAAAAMAAPGATASLGALTSGSSTCGPGDALASADSLDRSSDPLASARSELAIPTPAPAPALPRTSSPAATPAPHLALSRSRALLPQPSTSAARTYPAAPVYPAAGAAPPLDLILAALDAPTVASRTGGRVTPRGTPTPRGSPQRSRASTRDGTPPRDSTPPRDGGSSPRGTPVPRGTVTPMHTPLATPRVQGVQAVAPAVDGRAAPAPGAAPAGCADATPSQLVVPGYSPAPFSAYATACALATASASSAAVPTPGAGAGVAPSAQAAAAEEAAFSPPPPLPPRSAPPCDAGFARSPSSRHTHSAPLTHVAPSASASPPSIARQAPPSSTLAQLQDELDQKQQQLQQQQQQQQQSLSGIRTGQVQTPSVDSEPPSVDGGADGSVLGVRCGGGALWLSSAASAYPGMRPMTRSQQGDRAPSEAGTYVLGPYSHMYPHPQPSYAQNGDVGHLPYMPASAAPPAAAAAAVDMLEEGIAAAGVSSWFPAPPPRRVPDPTGPHQKLTVSSYTRAMAEGMAGLHDSEAAYEAAAAAAAAAVKTASAAITAARDGPAAAAATAPAPHLPKLPLGLLGAPVGVVATPTAPLQPPHATAEPVSFITKGGGFAGFSGLGVEADLDEWDVPLVPYPLTAPAGGISSESRFAPGRSATGGGDGVAAMGDTDGGGGGGKSYYSDSLPRRPAASLLRGPSPPPSRPPLTQAAAAAAAAAAPSGPMSGGGGGSEAHQRPPSVPRLALHTLRSATRSGGGDGDGAGSAPSPAALSGWTAAHGEQQAPAAAFIYGGATLGGRGESVTPPLSARSVLTGSLTSRTPCSKNVVGSVKALLRGWQTARAATSCGTGGGGGGAAEPSGGGGGGLTPQQRAAARFAAAEARSATVPGAPPSSPPPAAPPSTASSWSRESVAMAMAAAQGERGRLAAIYSGMLRHGEAAVRPNLESALLQHLQASQHHKASALKNKAASALVPTAHNGASAAAAVSAWAAARGGTPAQPAQAEPSCRVAAGPALAPPAPAASPRALAPYGRTSQRPMQSTRHASPSGRRSDVSGMLRGRPGRRVRSIAEKRWNRLATTRPTCSTSSSSVPYCQRATARRVCEGGAQSRNTSARRTPRCARSCR